jgi:hypothetical protein
VIVPPVKVLSAAVLQRLKLFASHGGKVYFLGRGPDSIRGRSFLELSRPHNLSWATKITGDTLSGRVLGALPRDVTLDKACPGLKYLHRKLADGDLYYFFNAAPIARSVTASLQGSGSPQRWDPVTGTIEPVSGASRASGVVRVPLRLAAGETEILVLGAAPGESAGGQPIRH